jgi:hypothetical protein
VLHVLEVVPFVEKFPPPEANPFMDTLPLQEVFAYPGHEKVSVL